MENSWTKRIFFIRKFNENHIGLHMEDIFQPSVRATNVPTLRPLVTDQGGTCCGRSTSWAPEGHGAWLGTLLLIWELSGPSSSVIGHLLRSLISSVTSCAWPSGYELDFWSCDLNHLVSWESSRSFPPFSWFSWIFGGWLEPRSLEKTETG